MVWLTETVTNEKERTKMLTQVEATDHEQQQETKVT